MSASTETVALPAAKRTYRHYTPKEKRYAVRLMRDKGFSLAEASARTGISPRTLKDWLTRNNVNDDFLYGRKRYTFEEKSLAVDLVKKQNISEQDVCRQLKVKPATLKKWLYLHDKGKISADCFINPADDFTSREAEDDFQSLKKEKFAIQGSLLDNYPTVLMPAKSRGKPDKTMQLLYETICQIRRDLDSANATVQNSIEISRNLIASLEKAKVRSARLDYVLWVLLALLVAWLAVFVVMKF